jgi:hypothetical protein
MKFSTLLVLTIFIFGNVSCHSKKNIDCETRIMQDSAYNNQLKLKSQQGTLTDCEFANKNAVNDYKNNDFSFHSGEFLTVENTFCDVLRLDYKIMWYFTNDLFSDTYYYCYDSIMTELLKLKYGNNFLTFAQKKADSLDKTGFWRRESSFKDGETSLKKYIDSIKKTIRNKYPSINFKSKRIFVKIEIDNDGNVTNPKVIRGINAKIDKFICELFLQMPKWNPSYKYGKPNRSEWTIPLNFDLN